MTLMRSGVSLARVGEMLHPGYRSGGFSVMHDGGVVDGVISAVDALYVYPFRLYQRATVSSIGVRLRVVGAGSSLKCAVWANDQTVAAPTGVPILGHNAGFDTSAGLGSKTAAIADIVLQPGIYWGGSVVTGTAPSMICVGVNASAATASMLTGSSAATGLGVAGQQLCGYSTPFVYSGDIMALDLTSAVWTDVISLTGTIPVMLLGWA